MSQRALITVYLAYKDLSADEDLTTKDIRGVYDVEKHDLTLVGFLGIRDIIN